MSFRYEILTRVSFTHSYFDTGRYTGFTVVPDTATAHLFRRLSLLFKTQADGFSIFFETGKSLQRNRADLLAEALTFQFVINNNDPDFLSYTDGIPENISDAVLYFRNTAKDAAVTGWLHQNQFFSVTDILHNARPDKDSTDKREFFLKPFAWMEITLHPALEDELFVNFRGKETIWRYIVSSDHLQDLVEPAVIHKDMKEPFSDPEWITLPDGKKRIAFQSKNPIALSNKPLTVFQLVDNYQKDTGRYTRVIQKALPNPDVKLISMITQRDANDKNIFSEILI